MKGLAPKELLLQGLLSFSGNRVGKAMPDLIRHQPGDSVKIHLAQIDGQIQVLHVPKLFVEVLGED